MAGELAVQIGRNMRMAREAKGWKQRELAAEIAKHDTSLAAPGEAAVSNTAVSEWERGVRKPSERYMPLIAAALDRPVEWFYTDHRKSAPTPELPAPRHEAESKLDRIEAKLDQIIDALVAAKIVEALEKAAPPAKAPARAARRRRAA